MAFSKNAEIVVAIPFAGGDSNSYRFLSRYFNGETEWVTLELPGRNERRHEPLTSDLIEMAERISGQFNDIVGDRKYAIFGHSLGAILGYELMLMRMKSGLSLPTFAYFTGSRPPDAQGRKRFSHLPSAQFWDMIAGYNGLPEIVVKDRALLAHFEPIIRSDCRALEDYPGREPQGGLPVPVHLRAGLSDDIPEAEIEAWRKFSSISTDIRYWPGHHFFIQDIGKRIADEIRRLAGEGGTL